MKLQPDQHPGLALVSAYGEGYIAINGQRHAGSVVVTSAGGAQAWDVAGFELLSATDFECLAALDVELVIFGTGMQHRFIKPEWLRPFAERRVGLEAMSTAAACRTYNFLAGEARRVAGAFLVEA